MAEEKKDAIETAEEPAAAETTETKQEDTKDEPKEEKKVKMSKNVEKIIEAIETMTVLEMADLVKALEDKFGVTAAAPVAMAAMPAAAEAAEEKTEFDVVLAETGEKKFQVVKVIRQVTDLGLKEAKDLVDNPGQVVKKEVSKAEAEEVKKKLEEAGAKVELK